MDVRQFTFGPVQFCRTKCNKIAYRSDFANLNGTDVNEYKQTHIHLHPAAHEDYMGPFFHHHNKQNIIITGLDVCVNSD